MVNMKIKIRKTRLHADLYIGGKTTLECRYQGVLVPKPPVFFLRSSNFVKRESSFIFGSIRAIFGNVRESSVEPDAIQKAFTVICS